MSSVVQRQAVLITGSTDGIGVTTAKNLAAERFGNPYTDVILHGRDAKRVEAAKTTVERFLQNHSNSADTIKIWTVPPTDLSTIQGGRDLAHHVEKLCRDNDLQLTCLMNNAGVYSEDHVITNDGLELTFAVNVVATFVLTSLLLPTMLLHDENNLHRRIVIASSISQCRDIRDWDDLEYNKNRRYSSHSAYSESKLLDAMLTMEFADRLQNDAKLDPSRITCNCLDPGTVNTKMLLAGWGRIGIDVEDALDQSWLCSSEEVKDVTGRYFVYRNDQRASASAYDKKERAKLWARLEQLAPDAAEMWKFQWLSKT